MTRHLRILLMLTLMAAAVVLIFARIESHRATLAGLAAALAAAFIAPVEE